jgi:hypothetical protein
MALYFDSERMWSSFENDDDESDWVVMAVKFVMKMVAGTRGRRLIAKLSIVFNWSMV